MTTLLGIMTRDVYSDSVKLGRLSLHSSHTFRKASFGIVLRACSTSALWHSYMVVFRWPALTPGIAKLAKNLSPSSGNTFQIAFVRNFADDVYSKKSTQCTFFWNC